MKNERVSIRGQGVGNGQESGEKRGRGSGLKGWGGNVETRGKGEVGKGFGESGKKRGRRSGIVLGMGRTQERSGEGKVGYRVE